MERHTLRPGCCFQLVMDEVSGDLFDKRVVVHLDGTPVHSESVDEHGARVRRVFERLRRHKLCVSREKRESLGFVSASDGMSRNRKTIGALVN